MYKRMKRAIIKALMQSYPKDSWNKYGHPAIFKDNAGRHYATWVFTPEESPGDFEKIYVSECNSDK